MRRSWLLVCLVLLSTSAIRGARINVTIDDHFGDLKTGSQITYLPEGAWQYGPSCPNCTIRPDAKKAHLGTWHVSTFNGSGEHGTPLLFASVPFYGSAIYVYCIQVSDTENPSSALSDMVFLIDALPVGAFTLSSAPRHKSQYNALVFADESLTLGNHTLVVQNGQPGGSNSLVMLDYIVYSYDELENSFQLNAANLTSTKTNSSSSDQRCGIIGGVLGSIIIVLLILVGVLYHQRDSTANPSAHLEPTSSTTTPRQIFSRYLRRPRFLRSETPSQLSFHPSLLVSKPENGDHVQISLPPVIPHPAPCLPHSPEALRHPGSALELTSTPSANRTSLSTPDPRSKQALFLSIVEWRRRTRLEAKSVQPRTVGANGIAFSSYYENAPPDSHHTPESEVLPPPPRRTQRRFTVMNN